MLLWLASVLPPAAAEQLHVAGTLYAPSRPAAVSDSQLAQSYYDQAWAAGQQADVSTALKLATTALAYHPDHPAARRVLGYRQVGSAWAGHYAARRIARGEMWHRQFGWIRAEDVERWEAGERPVGKRWISAAEDARRHATIATGWQIRTDHFRVTTNTSRQAAVELVGRLEEFYQLWQQQFAEFYLSTEQLRQRFAGKIPSGYRTKPFEVFYYRSREEYNRALRRQQPRIAMTLGIYFDTTRSTHFFAGPDQHWGTIYHEAVHQFFQETVPAVRRVGGQANAWAIEGVACYFESLQAHTDAQQGRYFTLGTAQAGRLPAARQRCLADDFYVPLAELSAWGMTALQGREDLARLYSQSAGLATFFMHHAAGHYRSAWVELLRLVYTGQDKTSTLEELTGQTFAALDKQYREFLAVEVAAKPTCLQLKKLQPARGVFHVPAASPSHASGNAR